MWEKREHKEQGTWGRKPKGPSKTGILIFEQTVTLNKEHSEKLSLFL